MNKELEALEKVAEDYKDLVIKYYYASNIDKNERRELFYKLDKDFEIIKKQLKALEIIKNKNVDVWLLKNCDYENYCRIRKEAMIDNKIYCDDGAVIDNELTQEEYDFLKEVLV